MNMHGIMVPARDAGWTQNRQLARRVREWIYARRFFFLIVVLPALLVGGYLYLIASNQYESEAHFLVRKVNSQEPPSIGMSQALSMVTGVSSSQMEAMSVADYLTSHDAVDTLRRHDALVQRFSDADADLLSRLRVADPSPELLLKYYRKQVKVDFNVETGITTLRVRSFRPQDSYLIARQLLRLGEQRVNVLNQRSYADSVANARQQLAEAETGLEQVQGRLTRFRQNSRDIDPETSGTTQIGLVATLTGQLAAARAQLNAMGGMIDRNSPQYRALAGRVAALQAQVAAQSGRLTGNNTAIANDISGYEQLKLRQQFLAKRYDAAASALERARETAQRQQLYVVRVVDANMPVKALFPERGRILATVVISLLLVYAIGWLIVAGVREHAA